MRPSSLDGQCKIVYWKHGAEYISVYQRQSVTRRFCRDHIQVHCNESDMEFCQNSLSVDPNGCAIGRFMRQRCISSIVSDITAC